MLYTVFADGQGRVGLYGTVRSIKSILYRAVCCTRKFSEGRMLGRECSSAVLEVFVVWTGEGGYSNKCQRYQLSFSFCRRSGVNSVFQVEIVAAFPRAYVFVFCKNEDGRLVV